MPLPSPLQLLWIAHTEMTPAQVDEYDQLDYAAFIGPNPVPNPAHGGPPEEWDSVDLHCFGLLDGRMVTHAGLVERPIRIAGQLFTAAGVGGVCTHPDFQRRGYAHRIMAEIGRAILADPRAHLGLLFCDPELVPYYTSCGWEQRTDPLYALQFGERVRFRSEYMLLFKPGIAIPHGEIDLQNKPW